MAKFYEVFFYSVIVLKVIRVSTHFQISGKTLYRLTFYADVNDVDGDGDVIIRRFARVGSCFVKSERRNSKLLRKSMLM